MNTHQLRENTLQVLMSTVAYCCMFRGNMASFGSTCLPPCLPAAASSPAALLPACSPALQPPDSGPDLQPCRQPPEGFCLHRRPPEGSRLCCPLALPPGCPPDLLISSVQLPGCKTEVFCTTPVLQFLLLFVTSTRTCLSPCLYLPAYRQAHL